MSYWEEQDKLKFTDWKVYIDNSSVWFDEINKQMSKAYTNTIILKDIFPQLRAFTSSRRANLGEYFEKIDIKLKNIKKILYSTKFNELKGTSEEGKWTNHILDEMDLIIQLLSLGLSDGELTPKNKKVNIPYKETGTTLDVINKAIWNTNRTIINKDGMAVSKH